LRGSWQLGEPSLPLPSLYSATPLLHTLLLPRLPDTLSPMSHDETYTRYLQPYPSASPSPDTSSPDDVKDNGPFDPGNTPPLVFAFIAIGFIVFGLVIVIIYKKCRPPPNSAEQPRYLRSPVPLRRPSAQKPQLWDVWIAPNQHVPDEDRTNVNDWDTFVVSRVFLCVSISRLISVSPQPLSASLVYPYSPPTRVPQGYVQGHITRPVSWESPENRLFFRRPPADTSLHVAVMISMPKPPPQQGSASDLTRTENEFHVGVTEVKWSG